MILMRKPTERISHSTRLGLELLSHRLGRGRRWTSPLPRWTMGCRGDSLRTRTGAVMNKHTPESYNHAYECTPDLFGVEPAQILTDHWRRLEPARPVLDLGCGQGRNSFFLARNGFAIDAMDLSSVALDVVSSVAAKERLEITTHLCDFQSFEPDSTPYSGILIFGLIQILTWDSISTLLKRLDEWTAPGPLGSLVFVSAFTTGDKSHDHCRRDWTANGRNSFMGPSGDIRTFLEPDEILDLFTTYEVLHRWEGLGPEHRHGDGPPERHELVEAVFQRC